MRTFLIPMMFRETGVGRASMRGDKLLWVENSGWGIGVNYFKAEAQSNPKLLTPEYIARHLRTETRFIEDVQAQNPIEALAKAAKIHEKALRVGPDTSYRHKAMWFDADFPVLELPPCITCYETSPTKVLCGAVYDTTKEKHQHCILNRYEPYPGCLRAAFVRLVREQYPLDTPETLTQYRQILEQTGAFPCISTEEMEFGGRAFIVARPTEHWLKQARSKTRSA